MKLALLAPIATSGIAWATPSPQVPPKAPIRCARPDTSKYYINGELTPIPQGQICQGEGEASVLVAGNTPPPLVDTPAGAGGGGGGGAPAAQHVSRIKAKIPMPAGGAPAGIVTSCPSEKATVTAKYTPPTPTTANADNKRLITYWSAWHGTGMSAAALPTKDQLIGVTHFILAFWNPKTLDTFVTSVNSLWNEQTAVELKKVNPNMKVMVAVGGWGLDEFFRFNATDENRDNLADVFVEFVKLFNLDGIDVDWEYPVGNGATYLTTRPNSPCDKRNNVLLMQSIRQKLDAAKPGYVLSLAVPALEGDINLAYDEDAMKEIDKVVDFWNIMSYDAMNRRSETTSHHAGGGVIDNTIKIYSRGVNPKKMNFGYPMYGKYFDMAAVPKDACSAAKPIGCKIPKGAFESTTGVDTGMSGVLFFNNDLHVKDVMGEIIFPIFGSTKIGGAAGWTATQAKGVRDASALATSYYDETQKVFYTWPSPTDVYDSCKLHLPKVGGVMVWSIDQDDGGAAGGTHFTALQKCLAGK